MKNNNDRVETDWTPVKTKNITINLPKSIVGDFTEHADGLMIHLEMPVSESVELPYTELHKSFGKAGFTPNESERLIGAMMDAMDHEQCMIALGQYIK